MHGLPNASNFLTHADPVAVECLGTGSTWGVGKGQSRGGLTLPPLLHIRSTVKIRNDFKCVGNSRTPTLGLPLHTYLKLTHPSPALSCFRSQIQTQRWHPFLNDCQHLRGRQGDQIFLATRHLQQESQTESVVLGSVPCRTRSSSNPGWCMFDVQRWEITRAAQSFCYTSDLSDSALGISSRHPAVRP